MNNSESKADKSQNDAAPFQQCMLNAPGESGIQSIFKLLFI